MLGVRFMVTHGFLLEVILQHYLSYLVWSHLLYIVAIYLQSLPLWSSSSGSGLKWQQDHILKSVLRLFNVSVADRKKRELGLLPASQSILFTHPLDFFFLGSSLKRHLTSCWPYQNQPRVGTFDLFIHQNAKNFMFCHVHVPSISHEQWGEKNVINCVFAPQWSSKLP